jgi:tetratricopeptide (TPR) repeat protein
MAARIIRGVNMKDDVDIDFSKTPGYNFLRGLDALGAGNEKLAEECFNLELEIDPYNLDARHKRAVLRYKSGNTQGTADDYIQIIEQNPDDAIAHENLGSIIDSTNGDPDEAIKHLTKAIRLNQNSVGAFYNRGNAYSRKGDMDRAISDFTQVIRLEPNHAWAYYNRGICYKKKGDFRRAYSDFTEAHRLDPTDKQAINQLEYLRSMGI